MQWRTSSRPFLSAMSVKLGWSPSGIRSSGNICRDKFLLLVACGLAVVFTVLGSNVYFLPSTFSSSQHIPFNKDDILNKCGSLKTRPGPPESFRKRQQSDRFEPGTWATLIRNARIWTAQSNGTHDLYGDVLLDKGIVKAIGNVPQIEITGIRNLTVVDAEGAWITPGLGTPHHLSI